MPGFVSSPPSATPDPDAPGPDLVAGDGWYPNVSLSGFRDAMRISTTVADPRARDALRGGIMSVRRELRAWKAGHVAGGVASLAEVDSETVDGVAAGELLYRRAVFSFAAADLAETHNDITATAEGKDRTEGRVLSADELRRNGTHAVRDILGVTRTAVDLI